MIERTGGKRRAGGGAANPSAKRRPRRGLWLMIGFCLIVFAVIVVYETRRELARQQQAATAPEESTAEAETPAASLEPSTLAGRLKEHYRSHELPFGWVVTGTGAPDDQRGAVRIAFAPSPQDRRYGHGAPLEDVQNGAFCPPATAKFWDGMADRKVAVELSDKTGVIRVIECEAVAR